MTLPLPAGQIDLVEELQRMVEAWEGSMGAVCFDAEYEYHLGRDLRRDLGFVHGAIQVIREYRDTLRSLPEDLAADDEELQALEQDVLQETIPRVVVDAEGSADG